MEILNRDASRIPTYVYECSNTYFGYVFRDLVNRWYPPTNLPFWPHRTKWTVIVSDEAVRMSKRLNVNETQLVQGEATLHRDLGYHLASSLYASVRLRDHPVVAMPTHAVSGDEWQTIVTNQSLLAFFDPLDMTRQDGLITDYTSALIDHAGSVDYLIFRIEASVGSIHGKNASTHLLHAGFQLQILSASHSLPLSQSQRNATHYGPNTQLRRELDMHSYFEYGRHVARSTKQVFQAYLFATKTLDMAIPSAQEYINLNGHETDDIVLNVDGDAIPYRQCPDSIATIGWENGNGNETKTPEHLATKCEFNMVPDRLWFSGTSPETSDLVCLECTPGSTTPELARHGMKPVEATSCITRYLPDIDNAESLTSNPTRRPNVLFLSLEQISHERFKKIMPLTRDSLAKAGFLSFDRYAATSVATDDSSLFWTGTRKKRLESELTSLNYQIFSVANGCNASNAISTNRAMKFNEMMCRQTPSRPNCIGSTLAAVHLLNYTREFLVYHSHHNHTWAAFLTLVEGQEETGILPGVIDGKLSKFLDELRHIMSPDQWKSTMIVATSDTGARRGSFAQTFDGQKEMIHPLLHLKMPNIESREMVQANRDRLVSQDDLMATLQVVISGEEKGSGPGQSLTSLLPDERNACSVLEENKSPVCDSSDMEKSKYLEKTLSVLLQPPPSVLSFYADIPRNSRKHLDVITRTEIPARAKVIEGCMCASNVGQWFPCSKHPWATVGPDDYKEVFMLVDCPGKATHLEIRVTENFATKTHMDKALPRGLVRMQPNVMFLEIDSVSGSYADRHLPKTREFLQKYRVRSSGDGEYQCYDGLCSADFTERVTLAGASSIPNQVASLSGCLSSDFTHLCGLNETLLANTQYCNDPLEPHFGLQIQRIRFAARQVYWCPPQPDVRQRSTPWIYGITHSLGYVNYFGEEFCYDGSPYVTQGNVFPVFYSDISPHLVFCRLAEQSIRRANVTVPDEHRWGFERHDQVCVDSDESNCVFEKARISLDMLEQMWNVYSARPKFAFLNMLAAHVYNVDWSQVFLAAERYDELLSAFLERMTNREDFHNTMIIVRSDHGLQKGPTAMNYNVQVEHTRPWTEILVPESFPSLSKGAFFENQNRLVSGHDLYHTIRSVIDQPSATTILPPLGDWSYDLLSTVVPEDRTCQDARVDPELCRKRTIHPSFGICNTLDSKQIKFCRSYEVKARVDPKDLPLVAPKKTNPPDAVPKKRETRPVGLAHQKRSHDLDDARSILKKMQGRRMKAHGLFRHIIRNESLSTAT
jgi:hypothetical protein